MTACSCQPEVRLARRVQLTLSSSSDMLVRSTTASELLVLLLPLRLVEGDLFLLAVDEDLLEPASDFFGEDLDDLFACS